MRTMLYAAYGSNLHPLRLAARAPTARLVGSAALDGMALRFHKRGKDGSGKCNVIAGDGAVHVAIYRMARQDRRALDRIEGAGYDAVTLDIPGFGRCFTYLATEDHIDDCLRPFDWYLALVVAGCNAHGFPAAYRAGIECVRANADPDRIRRETHMRLVREAEAAPIARLNAGATAASP